MRQESFRNSATIHYFPRRMYMHEYTIMREERNPSTPDTADQLAPRLTTLLVVRTARVTPKRAAESCDRIQPHHKYAEFSLHTLSVSAENTSGRSLLKVELKRSMLSASTTFGYQVHFTLCFVRVIVSLRTWSPAKLELAAKQHDQSESCGYLFPPSLPPGTSLIHDVNALTARRSSTPEAVQLFKRVIFDFKLDFARFRSSVKTCSKAKPTNLPNSTSTGIADRDNLIRLIPRFAVGMNNRVPWPQRHWECVFP